MNIAVYAVGDINVASSRLRSFYLFHSAISDGVSVFRNLKTLQLYDCDYLHLQSCYTPKYIIRALLFRLLGRIVIFDIGDIPERNIHFVFFILATLISNKITVPLKTTKKYIAKYASLDKIVVIPDVLDIAPNRLMELKIKRKADSKGILWTGHPGNLASIEEFIKILQNHKEYTLVVVTKLEEIRIFMEKYPWVIFMDWGLDSLLNNDLDLSYALLNHAPDAAAMYKCENKMVLAIALGLVPLVSNTYAYKRLAIKLSAECLIYNNLEEVLKKIEKLDSKWIDDFIKRARDYVITHYSSRSIFSVFISKCLQRDIR